MLFFPDFRAFERSYQLMSQVAGRAGRKGDRGKVLIQSYNPEHQIIRQVIDSDYTAMYKNELIDRRNFHYPPFYRLIRLNIRHRDQKLLAAAALQLALQLKQGFGSRILGPEEPSISRIRNFYHQNIMVKLERKASQKKAKILLKTILTEFSILPQNKSIRIGIDVDPY